MNAKRTHGQCAGSALDALWLVNAGTPRKGAPVTLKCNPAPPSTCDLCSLCQCGCALHEQLRAARGCCRNAGLRDPVVSRALSHMHARVAHLWTADELASAVFLSRSAFAERFTSVIGMPPMRYLAAWRMQVAAQRLREGHQSVAQVAATVGYDSEAAFTRAFKREQGVTPGAWRTPWATVAEIS